MRPRAGLTPACAHSPSRMRRAEGIADMLRYVNILAIVALLSSAVYAYSIKYQTILTSEQIVKTQHAIDGERDAIQTLKSEWAHLSRPERVQILADKHLDLQPLSIGQFVKAT